MATLVGRIGIKDFASKWTRPFCSCIMSRVNQKIPGHLTEWNLTIWGNEGTPLQLEVPQ